MLGQQKVQEKESKMALSKQWASKESRLAQPPSTVSKQTETGSCHVIKRTTILHR